MAITDISAFAHLTSEDVENLAVELDGLRREIEESRGARDARYIRRTIAAQRALELTGRVLLAASKKRSAWWAGTVTLAVAKIIENMEIGHNVLHGQWDWMNDPEIHSSTWEWDMAGAAKHWRITHNVEHHKYTNILDLDDDVGYGILRVTRDEPWKVRNLLNMPLNFILAAGFEWGIALQHLEFRKIWAKETREATKQRVRELVRSAGAQVFKDYVAFPAITALSPGATYRSTLTSTATANLIRNFWSNAVIFCGHFPDGAEVLRDRHGERDARSVVSAPAARQREFRRGSNDAADERQPVSSDRTSSLPGSAEQPAARDLAAGTRDLRSLRPSVHHRIDAVPIREDLAHHCQVVVAGSIPACHGRQCAGDS